MRLGGFRAIVAGVVWLAAATFWCVGYYLQEAGKLQKDAGITRHPVQVEAQLVGGYRTGRRTTPVWYVVSYRYVPGSGEPREQSVTVQASQLDLLGLTPRDVSSLYARPRACTVEYDALDPTISRLRGIAYHGGSSAAALWGGEILGAIIGLVGFFLLARSGLGRRRSGWVR